ncbi:hypothetical protein [Hymenobacter terricola]|uniref:hypothetical protein n=1 Tax=Hymenobacter terricola TaxID=2819236 RepID=UPI001B316072|nr:hypothetical protein [Hymenobacter terricola]
MRLAFLLLLAAWPAMAQAQAPASNLPAPATSRWSFGLKLGTGASYSSADGSGQHHPWSAYTGGLSGGYGFAAAGGFLNLQADALLERRPARPWQAFSASNAVLFVPFYLRTDRPAARVHLLLGGGPTFWLTGRAVPDNRTGVYATHPVEATGLLGFEVRLLPFGRYETTVALAYRPSLTPALVSYGHSSGGHAFEDYDTHSWFGATLNVYFHPAVRP